MKTVFPYPGGKSYLSEWIISHFPQHRCYVEPFGGGASVLVNKEPSKVEVYNDQDGDIVHFFRVMREQPYELIRWVKSRPYAKDLHEKYAKQFYVGYRPEDDIERAGRFFYLRKSQFAGKYDGYSGFRSSNRPIPESLRNAAEELEKFAARFRDVTIENRDFGEIFNRFDGVDTLFYCDPPYVQEGDDLYTGDEFNHSRFVDSLTGLSGKWIVSYTDVPPGLESYHTIEREASQHMRNGQDDMKRETRVERLVMNFNPETTPSFRSAEQRGLEQYG